MNRVDRLELLEPTLTALRERWGADALRRLRDLPPALGRTAVETGFPALDQVLDGGLSPGQVAAFLSRPTSGAASVALSAAAAAQGRGELVAWLDPGQTLDPGCAAWRGVHLDDLLLIQPEQTGQTWAILGDLAACEVFGLLAADATAIPPPAASSLRRLIAQTSRSPTAVILLTAQATGAAPLLPGAGLRLGFERLGWLREGRDIAGYTARVTVLKHPRGDQGRSVDITIRLEPGGEG